jgi:hypothetical protein
VHHRPQLDTRHPKGNYVVTVTVNDGPDIRPTFVDRSVDITFQVWLPLS